MADHASTAPSTDRHATRNAFILALVLVATLVGAFVGFGLAGLSMVMVGLVPVIFVVLIAISVGR